MKKILGFLFVVTSLAVLAASTFTPNYNLEKPADGDSGWGNSYRSNMDTIDSQMGINATAISDHVNDAEDAHAATAILTTPGSLICLVETDVQSYLDCLDSQVGNIVGGTVVTIADDQTITGLKTFTQSPIFSALGTGILHSDSNGNLTSSLIVNADVDGAAAIEGSKLDLSDTIVDADINAAAAIAASKLNLTGAIVDADVNASAAIDATKLGGGSVDNTEFSYVDGATSNIQAQIDAIGTGGADTDLGNLTATAINQDLLADGDDTRDLGSAAATYAEGHITDIYSANIRNALGDLKHSVASGILYDGSATDSVDYTSRTLKDGATIKLDWSGTDIDIKARKIVDVADPTSDQDAATKVYVDSGDRVVSSVASPNQLRIETAEIDCDAAPSIVSQAGDWLDPPTQTATGRCTIVIKAGRFSSPPMCSLTGQSTGNTDLNIYEDTNITRTVTAFGVRITVGTTDTNADFGVTCVGVD